MLLTCCSCAPQEDEADAPGVDFCDATMVPSVTWGSWKMDESHGKMLLLLGVFLTSCGGEWWVDGVVEE